MTDDALSHPRRNRVQPGLLIAHAGVVLVLLVVFGVLSAGGSGGGANIGAGLVGLPLIALGFPWSWLGMAAFDAFGPDRSFAHDPGLVLLFLGSRVAGAPLTVLLHWAAWRWWRRIRPV